MGIIRIHRVIERPIEIVNDALLEGLNVHKDMGNITAFSYSDVETTHSIILNPVLWPKGFLEPFIKVQLQATQDINASTFLSSEIYFKHKGFIPFRKMVLEQMIKFEAIQLLHQFKYRIEKWT